MSYYEPGLGAMLVKEGSLHSTEFVVATGLAAKQLRDTCLFADAAAVRIRELEASLREMAVYAEANWREGEKAYQFAILARSALQISSK
jgi:hypothetical protein